MEEVFKGEKFCSARYKSGDKKGKLCTNFAYYLQDGDYFCGVHSKANLRTELRANPRKDDVDKERNEERDQDVMSATEENQRHNRKGQVVTTKLFGMKNPEHKKGFMSVFPNFKHGNRTDGVGMPSLSPMKMGPIHHFVPNVGPATCLENFWQGSKLYVCESDANREPLPVYVKNRNAMFLDPKPQRHKSVSDPKSGVLHSVWYDEHGVIHKLPYVESRQVYCVIYEHFAQKSADFLQLQEAVEVGMNLNIIGYDAHDVHRYQGETLEEKFEAAYLDPKVPFGHEMCLQAMLLLSHDKRPWRKYHEINVFKP